jgi:hypothetical protein
MPLPSTFALAFVVVTSLRFVVVVEALAAIGANAADAIVTGIRKLNFFIIFSS